MQVEMGNVVLPSAPAMAEQVTDIPAMYGNQFNGTNFTSRTINIPVSIYCADNQDRFNQIMHNLSGLLLSDDPSDNGKEYPLVFGFEPKVTYWGHITAISDPAPINMGMYDMTLTITFVQSDPRATLPQVETPLKNGLNTITVDGTARTDPVIQVIPKRDLKYIGFSLNGGQFGLGPESPGDQATAVQPYTKVVNDPLGTMAMWTNDTNALSNMKTGEAYTYQGHSEIKTETSVMRPTVNSNGYDFGTIPTTGEDRWYGPAYRYNAIAPSTAKYVAIQIQAHNGKGHVAFSSAMLTQTAQSTGYQPDTGNVVSAGEIDGSVINGSTINGTTFHGGDSISDSNNTSNFYPFTIEPTGKASTTLFNSMGALRTEMSGGGLRTMYRAINSSGSQYEAYDGNFSGDMISLNSGFTNGKDMSFSQSVSGSQLTGQVLISPLNGLTLHGDTQQITFNGTSADVTPKGIIITPYGNINPNGTQNIWYVGNGPTMKTASFGIDGSGANNIQFNRSLDIGNFNINTYHTITSSDNGPIHFNRANGSSVDIFAATVNYTSLVKSSLLSVKKDVKKADTAYWAQLVNSIDLATYQYKTDDNTSHLRLSSIVDDVNVTKQWQLPDVFISRDENGKLSGVDDSVLLNATLATVQEQQKQINQLNGHNMELEARLNKLEAKLNG
nr:phage tail domain-containing protein [Lactiplantibacillus plantarum]